MDQRFASRGARLGRVLPCVGLAAMLLATDAHAAICAGSNGTSDGTAAVGRRIDCVDGAPTIPAPSSDIARPPDEPQATLGGSGETWLRRDKQFAETTQTGANFGNAVAIDGDWLAVGAPSWDDIDPGEVAGRGLSAVGKVALYQREGNGWTLRYSIIGTQQFAQFGWSVALRGDDLVVGAPGHDLDSLPNIGQASFYRREGTAWIANGTYACCFSGAATGSSVALSRTRDDTFAYVGAPGARSSLAGPATGLAFALRRIDTGWSLENLPTPNDLAVSDKYGTAVAASGSAVVVGASLHDTDGVLNSGAAYVLGRSMSGIWSQTQKLSFFDTTEGDVFGGSVAINGSWIAVGSTLRSVAGHPDGDTGAVQIFRYTTQYGWSTWQELTGLNAASGDVFGNAVAFDGSTLLVGARFDNTLSVDGAGAAYFFHRGTSGTPPQPDWQQSAKFFADSPAMNDYFGTAVALDGQAAVVGALNDDTDGAPSLADAGSITTFLTDGMFADGFD